MILKAASGRHEAITVFGRDYATDDGTCIRDYIHIQDLCSAHLLALNFLMSGKGSGALAFNLGNGAGYSVQQVIDVVKRVVAQDGRRLLVKEAERRAGDPAVLVADAQLARKVLGWQPQYADLDTIVRHAWAWELKN